MIKEVSLVVENVDVDYLFEEIPKAIEQTLEGVSRVSALVGAMKEFSHPGTGEKVLLDLNRAIESTITASRNEWKYVGHKSGTGPCAAALHSSWFQESPLTGIITGIAWHMVGAASAASFYAPISKVKRWTWESTWAVAGIFSWVLLPIAVSAILLPDMRAFYGSLDASVVLKAFLFGCMWGVGNVSYGLTMRYLGMSLGIGVAIGVTLVVGTLIPPLMHGQANELVSTRGGLLTLLGIAVALCGIVIVSVAGHRKEIALGSAVREFDVKKGLMLAVMCGIFSSGMSFAIDAAKPIQASALLVGVKPLYAALPSYVIIMGGGGLVNFIYCFSRLFFKKELSLKADLALPGATLFKNGSLAATGGIMWYLQFFFYAWGAASIPASFAYVNWMLHMSGYVLFGGIVGLALGEWTGVGSKPVRLLWAGMLVIIAAANIVGLGMAY